MKIPATGIPTSLTIKILSKVLFKLTGIFLILHISTSATPNAQPGDSEAQKINDEIHARVGPYYPYLCKAHFTWLWRECVRALGPMAWRDVCGRSTYYTNYRMVYDNQSGSCPRDSYCLDTFNANNERFIDCVSVSKAAGKRKLGQFDPQIGASGTKRAANQLSNTQFEYSVTLDHDMTAAAVVAILRSELSSPC